MYVTLVHTKTVATNLLNPKPNEHHRINPHQPRQ